MTQILVREGKPESNRSTVDALKVVAILVLLTVLIALRILLSPSFPAAILLIGPLFLALPIGWWLASEWVNTRRIVSAHQSERYFVLRSSVSSLADLTVAAAGEKKLTKTQRTQPRRILVLFTENGDFAEVVGQGMQPSLLSRSLRPETTATVWVEGERMRSVVLDHDGTSVRFAARGRVPSFVLSNTEQIHR